jgi:hypothetical protein
MFKLFSFFLSLTLVSSKTINSELKRIKIELPLAPFDPNAPIISRDSGSRISGGSPAHDGQFPFVNEINVSVDGSYLLCTGAFLTTSWSITALHCLKA